MKKITSENEVVLTMTGRECQILKMLITSGIIRRTEEDFWSEEEINEWRELRDKICDYE